MATDEIRSGQKIIDSRDVIARLKDLERWKPEGWQPEAESIDWDEGDEYEKLKPFAEEGADSIYDWHDGATLILESHFEDYARELAVDIGAARDLDSWPCNCIDWERAANLLKMDYTTLEFDGETYYTRNT